MLFLARVLHMPDGGQLRNRVVEVFDGVVNDIYCFSGEVPSMTFLDDVFVATISSLESVEDINKASYPVEDERLYAYGLNGTGKLFLL